MQYDNLPSTESMRHRHKVRRFRRSNAEHGRAYLARKSKPWKNPHYTLRSAA